MLSHVGHGLAGIIPLPRALLTPRCSTKHLVFQTASLYEERHTNVTSVTNVISVTDVISVTNVM